MIPPIPSIARIVDSEWDLRNYTLGLDICKCIFTSSTYLHDKITKLYLESNNLEDEGFNYFLKSLEGQKEIKTLYYAYNKLGSQSASKIIDFIRSKDLQNLTLNHLSFEKDASSIIIYGLYQLLDIKIKLKSLHIVAFDLNEYNLNWLIKIFSKLHEINLLKDIDLSWNKLPPTHLNKLLHSSHLSSLISSSLAYLNLAFNRFGDENS